MAIVNVKSFGATGDGVTDDTTAFLDALDMLLNTYETGYLYCPSGEYLLTQQLIIDKPFVGIKGDGIQTSILTFSGSGIQLSSFADFSLAVIEGITISGPGSGVGSSIGISMPNSNFYFLSKFYVANFDIGIDASTAVLSKFTDFSVAGCRIGARFTDGSYAVSIINGNVRSCSESGIIEQGSALFISMTDVEAIGGTAITTGGSTLIRDCHIESSNVAIGIGAAGNVLVDNCFMGGCNYGIKQIGGTFYNGKYFFSNIKFSGCTEELDINEIAYYQIEDVICTDLTGTPKALTTIPPIEYGVMKGLAYDPGNTGYFVSYKAAGILVNGKGVMTSDSYAQTINFGTIAANSSQQFDFYEAAGPFSEWSQMLLWCISSYEIPLGLTFTVFVKPSSLQYVHINVTNTTASSITIGSRLFILRTI